MQVVWPNLHLPSKTCIKSFKSHGNTFGRNYKKLLKIPLQKEKPFAIMRNVDPADIAQLVERLIRNHQVMGSSPIIGFGEV